MTFFLALAGKTNILCKTNDCLCQLHLIKKEGSDLFDNFFVINSTINRQECCAQGHACGKLLSLDIISA